MGQLPSAYRAQGDVLTMVSDRWLVSLPKAEVHVHLEGSFDHDFVAAAAARAGMELPDRSRVHDLAQLLEYLDTACRVITDAGQLEELAYRFARREAGCGVRYADAIVNPSHWPAWTGRLPAFVAALDRGFVPSIREHPLDKLGRAGVLITLNTDDPALLGTDLISEYRTCAQAFGWGEDTLCAVARTSVEAAFASPTLRSGLLRDLQEFASANDAG